MVNRPAYAAVDDRTEPAWRVKEVDKHLEKRGYQRGLTCQPR
jgi:hypothetical protein